MTWRGFVAAGVAAVVSAAPVAAHELQCEQRVALVTEEGVSPGGQELRIASYPATVRYDITLRNALGDVTSDVLAAKGALLGGAVPLEWGALPLALGGGEQVSRSGTVTLQDEEACLAAARAARSDAACLGDRCDEPATAIEAVFVARFDGGIAQCRSRVECSPVVTPPACEGTTGPSRDLGWWKPRRGAVEACLSAGPVDLGVVRVDTLAKAEGLLWGNPLRFPDGSARGALDRGRYDLAREALVAACNERLFAASLGADVLAGAVAALGGRDCGALPGVTALLRAANGCGSGLPVPEFLANPIAAQRVAVDPLAPSNAQCE